MMYRVEIKAITQDITSVRDHLEQSSSVQPYITVDISETAIVVLTHNTHAAALVDELAGVDIVIENVGSSSDASRPGGDI